MIVRKPIWLSEEEIVSLLDAAGPYIPENIFEVLIDLKESFDGNP